MQFGGSREKAGGCAFSLKLSAFALHRGVRENCHRGFEGSTAPPSSSGRALDGHCQQDKEAMVV